MKILTLETPPLGDRSYVVTDGKVAAVIDPQRDLDRLFDIIDDGIRVTHVLETHVHNDYVSGGLDLARQTGAAYLLPEGEETHFGFRAIGDGDEIALGTLKLRAFHTPGHTPTHMSYVVTDGTDTAVFTGGSLLYGSVGRTDLVARARTDELTRHQYRSAHRLADTLPAQTVVLPTHGFGSFCTSVTPDTQQDDAEDAGTRPDDAAGLKAQFDVEVSTIAEERRNNLVLTTDDIDRFVEVLTGGLGAYPRYYAHMRPRNLTGPGPIDLTEAVEADPTELARRIHAGEWVVDLRSRTAFAADHVTGTINAEVTDSMSTYLAWMLPWGTPVTLIGDTQDEVSAAQRQLVRVGIERPAAQAVGGVQAYGASLDRSSYRIANAEVLGDAVRDGRAMVLLDVRRDDERARGTLNGAIHIPFFDLEARIAEVPNDEEVWVFCRSGYRASVAASVLARAGRTPVLLDDEYDNLREVTPEVG